MCGVFVLGFIVRFVTMHRLPLSEKRIPLGVTSDGNAVFLYYNRVTERGIDLRVETSRNGLKFSDARDVRFTDRKKSPLPTKKFSQFKIVSGNRKYLLLYKYYPNQNTQLCNAVSDDLYSWQKLGKVTDFSEIGTIVPNYSFQGKYVMFYGEQSVHIAESANGSGWQTIATNVLTPVSDFYGTYTCSVAQAVEKENGLLLYYYLHRRHGPILFLSLHAALFAKNNPKKLLWQTNEPLWQIPKSWMRKRVQPVGVVEHLGILTSYWWVNDDIYAIQHSEIQIDRLAEPRRFPSLLLDKIKENPIIRPIADHFWESKATFNPAAIYDEGKVHIIYRAIGHDDVSTLGYASSRDGVTIDERLPTPIYIPTKPFETGTGTPYVPSGKYVSGGGCYGGCEDPRITKLDGKFYMTYVAYDGSSPPRVALTSIDERDFHRQQWRWTEPQLISKPGIVNKNACVLPERIHGKYVIFHRVFPNILIDYVDSLDFDGSAYLKGEFMIPPRPDAWDSRKLGIGAPPLKTDEGWLLIYQAVDDRYDRQYKIGAMLLDADDPTKVLYRPRKPILEPTEDYENSGHKWGVVYPCGAVVKDDDLFVYYGGADMVTCVAKTELSDFLYRLKASEPAHMTRVTMHS